jgi:CheY-like chemotaxis protein
MSGTSTGPARTGMAEGKQMSQPVIFVIDGDAGVTAALREDLDRRFGEDFRVIGEPSAAAGLAALRRLADAGEPVALLIVDHNLSAMPGVEFLARGLPLETSIPGVFAAGDVRCRSIKRVASAVGDGATAVRLVHEYLATEHADALAPAVRT